MNTQRHKTVALTSTTHTMLRDAQVLEAKEKQGYTAGASHLPDRSIRDIRDIRVHPQIYTPRFCFIFSPFLLLLVNYFGTIRSAVICRLLQDASYCLVVNNPAFEISSWMALNFRAPKSTWFF